MTPSLGHEVSAGRWHQAQQAERAFWDGVRGDAATVAAALASQAEAASWLADQVGPQGLPAGDVLEIGIGPLGVGIGAFLGDRKVVGLDPLPLAPLDELTLPAPLLDAVRGCRRRYEHRQARGEETGLESGRFGVLVIGNALDHVQLPGALLDEARRVLAPEGVLFVSCESFSLAGLVRFHAWTRRRHPDQILVRAHPFRFHARTLLGLVRGAGFTVVADNRPARAWPREVVGRATLSYVLARR